MAWSMGNLGRAAALPALVLSLAVAPASATPTRATAAGLPGGSSIVLIDDMMGMPAKPMDPAAPPGGPPGGMAGGGMMGGMMGDMKMGMPMQPPGPPGAGGMPGGGKMAADPLPPTPSPATGVSNGAAQMPANRDMPWAMLQAGQASDPLDHFDGRVAFLKAEIGITDTQEQAWDQFALALRADRQHLLDARQALTVSMGPSDSLSRLAAYEQHLTIRLDALRTAREGYARVYGTLDATQKQAADDLALPFLEAF